MENKNVELQILQKNLQTCVVCFVWTVTELIVLHFFILSKTIRQVRFLSRPQMQPEALSSGVNENHNRWNKLLHKRICSLDWYIQTREGFKQRSRIQLVFWLPLRNSSATSVSFILETHSCLQIPPRCMTEKSLKSVSQVHLCFQN